MAQRRTEALRKWAHEEAFVRGDEWPHIPCHAILETLDRLCDEIDDIAPANPTLEEVSGSLNELIHMSSPDALGDISALKAEQDRFAERTEGYIRSVWDMAQEMSAHEFEELLDQAYEASIEQWETRDQYDPSPALRIHQALFHIAKISLFSRWGPIGIREKKGLVCWLVATGRLPVEQGGGC